MSFSFSTLKKKDQFVRDFMTVSGAEGDVSYVMTSVRRQEDQRSCRKNFEISSTDGTITVKSGIKKGTYKVKLRVSASGNVEYKAGEKYVAVYVTIA